MDFSDQRSIDTEVNYDSPYSNNSRERNLWLQFGLRIRMICVVINKS